MGGGGQGNDVCTRESSDVKRDVGIAVISQENWPWVYPNSKQGGGRF